MPTEPTQNTALEALTITSWDDLLTAEANEQLRRDLAEIAECSRKAWRDSQGIVIG